MKHTIAITLSVLLCFGQIAHAQSIAADTPPMAQQPEDAPVPPPNTTDGSSTSSPDSAPAGAMGQTPTDSTTQSTAASSTPIQDTTNTQDTVAGDVLQGASNPEDLATTTIAVDASSTPTEASSTPISIDATSTPDVLPVDASTTLDVIAQDVQPDPADEPPADTASQPDEVPTPDPVPPQAEPISAADLAPKPEYTFAMTGKHIAATRLVRDTAGRQQTVDVTQSVTPQIDNTTGVMHIAGACSNTYYVVLLFKDQDDYARDPKSYILDKAFPCVGGQFSYSISDLPDSLNDGTYYLLVGEEGDKGPWAPITALTEVTINRNH